MRDRVGHDGRHGHHLNRSAQTFRRGRVTGFLEHLQVRRSTLQRQLQDPEYADIRAVISGELKATDAIIDEFMHVFQLHESTIDGNRCCRKASNDQSSSEQQS